MAEYIIKIEGLFSTSVFYKTILKELHNCFSDDKENRVIFDFTEVTYIDALVIPNLLSVGYIIKKATNKIPIISAINNSIYAYKTNIMQYLYDIGFTKHAKNYGLFEIHDYNIDKSKKMLPEYCTTFCFNDGKQSKESIAEQIMLESGQLFNEHLKEYFDDDEIFGYKNIFAKFAAELCNNSAMHGKSFSFMTIQSNRGQEKVSIAVSDCGCGFYESLYKKIINKSLERPLLTIENEGFLDKNTENLSLHSIIECTFYRYFDRAYGIWDIAKTVLNNGGVIRIHSNDSRIILTPNKFPLILEVCNDPEALKDILLKEFLGSKDYNFITGLKFGGVHFEIEMPMKHKNKGWA
jgi:hypothetical protein